MIVGDKYIFEMRSPPRAAYIATGLSSDVSKLKQNVVIFPDLKFS